MPRSRSVVPYLALAMLVAAPLTSTAQQRPMTDQLKLEAEQMAASMQKMSQEIVDSLFSFGELGFQEFWTVDYLTGILEAEGFTVETGCAGMPTCYVATWGSGKPVIGFMGDIDGLPETSQKPGVAYRDPLIENGPGHGEGHNSAAAVDLVGAIVTKRLMEKYGLQGTLKIIPGVAEELVASRTYMVNAGIFDGMDIMLSTHISSGMTTNYGISGSGLVSTQFTFHGQSAHGAGSPWAGRSALDAVELMDTGWNFRREHLRLQQRSHYIIDNGGNQPNVVPSEASVWYYFRELDYDRIKGLHEIGQRIAQGAAMMTDTTVTERVYGAAWPSNMNKPLAELMHANILEAGLPEWSDADQEMARAVQTMMAEDRGEEEVDTEEMRGLPTEFRNTELREASQGMGGGSDDIAEVSWNLPTVRLRYPGQIPGTTGHHWSSSIAMATPIAHKGANQGARVIAMTAIALVNEPELVDEAWTYFRDVTTAEQQWASLIPEGTPPPIHLNAEKMERFRPLLEPLRYDPSRYDTYLQQLGIQYPTTRPRQEQRR
ncbi:MAG: amidohydrolase [Acidobacteriota bacterium]|jgi:aminobenzoyl-glutamate utilization protein B